MVWLIRFLILEKALNHGEHGDTAGKQELARCVCFTRWGMCVWVKIPRLFAESAVLAVVQMRF
jgi:hypothetical protein